MGLSIQRGQRNVRWTVQRKAVPVHVGSAGRAVTDLADNLELLSHRQIAQGLGLVERAVGLHLHYSVEQAGPGRGIGHRSPFQYLNMEGTLGSREWPVNSSLFPGKYGHDVYSFWRQVRRDCLPANVAQLLAADRLAISVSRRECK